MEVPHYPTLDKKSREKQLFSPLSRPISSVGSYPGGTTPSPYIFSELHHILVLIYQHAIVVLRGKLTLLLGTHLEGEEHLVALGVRLFTQIDEGRIMCVYLFIISRRAK